MYDKFKNFLNKNSKKKFLLLSHPSPDPDSIGSSIGLSLFLDLINIENDICVPGGIGKNSDIYSIADFIGDPKISSKPLYSPDITIILDTPNEDRFEFEDLGKIVFIDHHEVQNPTDISIIDPDSTSTSELIFKLIEEFDLSSEKSKYLNKIYRALLVGIVGDTSKFRYANTQTFSTVYKILSKSEIELETIYQALEGSDKTKSQKMALLKGSKRINILEFKNKLVVTSKVGAHQSLLCNYLISMGADIAIVGSEKGGKVVVSTRSRLNANINLSKLLEDVSNDLTENGFEASGGGHRRAAGIQVSGTDIDHVLDRILDKIEEKNLS